MIPIGACRTTLSSGEGKCFAPLRYVFLRTENAAGLVHIRMISARQNYFYAMRLRESGKNLRRERAMKSDMEGKDWVHVLDEADMPEGNLVAVYPLGVNIAMARFMGKFYAFEGKCFHMGCPLASGTLEGSILTCPCHDWRFDIRTGEFIAAAELRLAMYPMRNENGKLLIGMNSKGESDE
jgi:3-phenylpropionate/trans-cinnamate dioxygenase ferredoxin subunit